MEMAQFRELESFAQFGSDLDASTQRQINRGRRLVEVLKQPQYQPMPEEDQIMILFAAANGYLDKWPVESIADYENQMIEAVKSKYSALLKDIRESGEISNDLAAKLKKALDEFQTIFQPLN
jgi:F-type H+-transporting ATPase subunit alpha